MIGAAFRLGFVVACCGCVLGLVVLAHWQGFWVAVSVGLGGLLVAVVLAEDWQQPLEPTAPRRRRIGRPRTRPYEGES